MYILFKINSLITMNGIFLSFSRLAPTILNSSCIKNLLVKLNCLDETGISQPFLTCSESLLSWDRYFIYSY
jgi:hypothetical protein